MSKTTVFPCPFCGHDDPEIGEVAPSEFAVDCPECRCAGPITGDVMSAIEAWNKAPRWPRAAMLRIEHPKVPA